MDVDGNDTGPFLRWIDVGPASNKLIYLGPDSDVQALVGSPQFWKRPPFFC